MNPDPIHPHYDQEGNRLDGPTFKSLNTVDEYTPDPSLETYDITYQIVALAQLAAKSIVLQFQTMY
jgi:hypothetical protein